MSTRSIKTFYKAFFSIAISNYSASGTLISGFFVHGVSDGNEQKNWDNFLLHFNLKVSTLIYLKLKNVHQPPNGDTSLQAA